MQWLIDIILELIEPMLAALKVTIHGQLGYFDRGDPAATDFTKPDFIRNNAWHTLDISAIVPENTVCVLFAIRARSPNITKDVRIRKFGNTHDVVRSIIKIQTANIDMTQDWSTACSADRKIEYRTSPDPWTLIELTVKGWWLR